MTGDQPVHEGGETGSTEDSATPLCLPAGPTTEPPQELLARAASLQAELDSNLRDAHQASLLLRRHLGRQPTAGEGPDATAVSAPLGTAAAAVKELVGLVEACLAQVKAGEETRMISAPTGEEESLTRDRALQTRLREREAELEECSLQLVQRQSEVEELRAAQQVHAARAARAEQGLGEGAKRAEELARQLEEKAEQCRLLSDENVTLRLMLGQDRQYMEVLEAPSDPLSHKCASGRLNDELRQEEQRFHDDLSMLQFKFPGLAVSSDNCKSWCATQLSRQCGLHRSFLHRLQDQRQEFPSGVELEFLSKAQAVGSAWHQREEEVRDADAAFHEREKVHTKHWEEKRLQLTAERDTKIRQLLEQGERSQSKAERQLLMQQAKMFGQRLDGQLERAWEAQRKEREERWKQHSKLRDEGRKKLEEESQVTTQCVNAEGSTPVERFRDMVRAKLCVVEDAWLRNLEKAGEIAGSTLRHGDLLESLQAAGFPSPAIPAEGSQQAGVQAVAGQLEDVIERRIQGRRSLEQEFERQTLQQLRSCVDAFVQKETAQHKVESRIPEAFEQAATIRAVLQSQQHRVVADTVRRQFHDFLLILRVATLGAAWLLPGGFASASLKQRGARLDLPPPGSEAAMPSLYDELLQSLLQQTLTLLQRRYREELLGLKRSQARELRRVLEQLCQLEPDVVEWARRHDTDEFQNQVKSKLLSDSERRLTQERRQLLQQVEDELAAHTQVHSDQAAEEEREALAERARWLGERLLVVESQACICPGDRSLIRHLRAELDACQTRLQVLEAACGAEGQEQLSPKALTGNPAVANVSIMPDLAVGREAGAGATAAGPTASREAHASPGVSPVSTGTTPTFGTKGTSFAEDLLSMAVDTHPLYSSPLAAPRSLSAPGRVLPPLRQGQPGLCATTADELPPVVRSGSQSARHRPHSPGTLTVPTGSGALSARGFRAKPRGSLPPLPPTLGVQT